MAVLTSEIIKLAERKDTLKAIATTNHEGVPHITYKESLHIEDGYIVFYDLIQSSQTNKNLVDAIWYIRPEKSRDNSYFARAEYERKNHPLIRRLDMIRKQ